MEEEERKKNEAVEVKRQMKVYHETNAEAATNIGEQERDSFFSATKLIIKTMIKTWLMFQMSCFFVLEKGKKNELWVESNLRAQQTEKYKQIYHSDGYL